ncbi:transcription antitermination factor NusB [Rudanella paleaurantiibacter]|uniref:Transcription antitermination protein NusB n=1 Tax=Rudanella paleaurantiibacter TaxID=2614655 RepID=A0A7J5U1D8_9BACT|nr:transcription antitermination factor NusB [Rudanella paleaurantiibacter]KAB7731489.1 transcription antitermination factor NusB [Rudanella paleaurantiibacter]
MQAVYALRQAELSNQQIALDGIAENFQPDLNSMQPQDKRQLEGHRKLASVLFEEAIKANQPAEDEDAPTKVLKAANDGLVYYRNRGKKDRTHLAQMMIDEVQGIYDDYLRVLLLLVELGHAAQIDRERQYRDVDEEPFPFESTLYDNSVVKALASHQPLTNEAVRRNVNWTDDLLFVRKALKESLKQDATYRAYCEQKTHTPDEDQALVQYVLRTLVFKHELIRDFLAEIDLSWTENSEVVRGMAIKTLKSVQTMEGLKLEPLTDDWEEDLLFLNTLFNNVLDNDGQYEQLLADQLKNWDVERVAMLDRIILKLAVCELMSFPGIPVKVTINEYIELAKAYSTPKSGKFVNGILDNLSTKLQNEGKLRKSGRGLLDNK